MQRKKQQKRFQNKQVYLNRRSPLHIQALARIDHELKDAYRKLSRHAKSNTNMFTFAHDMKRIMLLMAKMRYLINECKIAQQNTQKFKKRPKKRKKAA